MTPVPTSDPTVTANGYFVYKSKNGSTLTGSVLLKNPSNKELTIELAAVDAITAQTGGSAFETAGVKPKAVATWLKFAQASVTLAPGTQKPVEFTVAVPQSVKPGQYLAGISAYVPTIPPTASQHASGQLGASVTMQTRYVIGVQVDVEGVWTPSLLIESTGLVEQPSGPFIGVQMKNDGDTFLKPSGMVVLTDTGGKRVLYQAITMSTFIPGTAITYPVKWNGELKPGDYLVHVEMKYGENSTARYDRPLHIEAASMIASQPQPQMGREPGRIGAGAGTGTIAPSDTERMPAKSPMTERWLVVTLSGLILVTIWVWVVIMLRRRSKDVTA
ncbi:MAG TPA: DUF916 domain-containing protein [Chloroflexia bacterium]|nr:DUF916 domain-containing protein [Chloroflexia bacterium]